MRMGWWGCVQMLEDARAGEHETKRFKQPIRKRVLVLEWLRGVEV